MSMIRTRWAAIGAAVAITLGGGGVGLVGATIDSGERSVLVPIEPCRIIDTRPDFQVGPRSTPIDVSEIYGVAAHGTNGECTIPTDAVGLSLNVTAVDATHPTFLTIFASDVARPNASHLNPAPGQPPTPNAVTTALSSTGEFDIFNKQGTVHVFADVVGYYADHTHDDLYYGKKVSDGRYVSANPRFVRLSAYDMEPPSDDTNWKPGFMWTHTPTTASPECIGGRIALPAGMDVSGMSIVYFAPIATASVQVTLYSAKATSGSVVGALPPVAQIDTTVPVTGSLETKDLTVPIVTPTTVNAAYDYVIVACTQDEVAIGAATVELLP